MAEYRFRDFLAEQMQDPEFRREWEASRPEFEAMCADLDRRIAAEENTVQKIKPCAAKVAV